jgi:hypothetical protein
MGADTVAVPGPDPKLTRPDQPLPGRRPGPTTPPLPTLPPAAPDGRNWHRFHFPIGAFLVAYGVTSLLFAGIGWSDRREEMAGYLGSGAATGALVAVKAVELLLVAVTLAGMTRRKDVWLLPALMGWILGFAVFCALDVVKGKWTGLAEHAVYLLGFVLLLFLTYALSVKARVGRPGPLLPETPVAGAGPPRLTRTQEMALAAINRWQRQPGSPPPPTG